MDCPTVPKKRAKKMPRMKVKGVPGMKNKEELLRAKEVGCFKCLATFSPKDIKSWIDGGETALCPMPKCEVDSVIARNANDSAVAFETRLKKLREERFDSVYDKSREDGTAVVVDAGMSDRGEYVTVKMFGSDRIVTHYESDTDGAFQRIEALSKH